MTAQTPSKSPSGAAIAGAGSSRSPLDWLVLAALVMAWGSGFAGLKIAVHDIAPAWNTVIRLWVATALLWALCAARGETLPALMSAETRRPAPVWLWYAALGLVGLSLPFFLFAYSAGGLPSAINAICNGSSPLFTALLSHLFLPGEKLSLRRAAGVGLGFVGLLVLVGPRMAQGGTVEVLALSAALTGGLLYAASNIITGKSPRVGALAGALMMCLLGAVFATLLALLTTPVPQAVPPLPALVAVVALGVFSTALGSVGYVWLVQRRGPVFMSMSIYLAPLWATGLGVLLLGERPGWTAFAALALVLAGVGLTTWRGVRT